MAEKGTLWASIEEMPEFQEKTPEEKLGYASYFLEKQAAKLAPELAGNPEGQAYFRDKSKSFLFGIADRHFPSGLEAAPSQIGESLAREDRALSLEGARMNTEIGKQAETTLAGLEGKADDEMLKGDPTTFQTLSPNQDTTVGEYKTYLKSVIDAQAVKSGKKAGDIVESFDESAKRTPSAAMLKLQLSEGWAGWDELIAKSEDPIDTAIAAISGTMLESGVQSAKGAVAGAAATAATGNPLVGGAVMGGVAGESEYQATYLGELQTEIQKRGKADAATIQEILKDDEFNARVDKKAMTRGVAIGATEAVAGALSFGIANKIGTTTAKKALIGVGAEAGIGAVGGSGGEFLARLFSGEDIWTPEARKDIVSEGVAEIGQAGTGTATVGFKKTIEAIKGRPSQSAATPDSGQQSPASNEEENLQAPPQVNEPATPEPEVDDAPVRSVIEEFSDEADATEVPAVAPLPESPLPVIEPESTAAETPPATEVNTPAPVEAPAVVDEVAPETVDLGQPEVINTFDIDEGLRIEVIRNPDGSATVEKINTETGVTIPLEGAAAPFENPKAALDFLSSTFTRNRDGDIVTEVAAKEPGILERGEQDELMMLLQAEKMQPSQADIRTIGRVARKEGKGFRALESDASSRGQYRGAPLLRDYQNNPTAQERLRSIYSRESGNRPDQVAQMAFNNVDANGNPAPLISAPTAEALFQAIRERLDGDGGLVSQRRESDAEIADMVAERASQVENDFETFYRAIKSPYRRGGVLPARQFLPGDVLQVGTDTVEVTDTNEDRVTFRSREGGIFELTADETIGFDSMEENGVPASERETIPQEDRVSREDAVALTAFIRERLNLRGGNSQATVVPSREHSALAKNVSELNAARRISRFFDSTVVGVSSFPAQGAISRKQVQEAQANGGRKVVFLATDASRVEVVLVMHEMLHTMAVTDPDLYNELLVAMGVVFGKDGNLPRDENGKRILGADLEEYISRVRPEHESLSDEMLVEEYLADLLAERAGTKEFWQGLALRDPSAFERIANFVLDFLRQVADRIRNDRVKVERFLRDQAAMRNAIEEVMVAFRARQSQDRSGIPDVPLDESMPFADQRFTATDAAYLSAIESGDMETVQLMVDEAAKRAGVTNPEDKLFRSESVDVADTGGAVFFSDDPTYVALYEGEGRRNRSAYKPKEILDLRQPASLKLISDWVSNQVEILENRYYDGDNIKFAPLKDARRFLDQGSPNNVISAAANLWLADRKSFPAVGSVERSIMTDLGFEAMYVPEYGRNLGEEFSVAFRDPSVIRSADPVTYDESGQVIPLSQRFNPASDEITYSVITNATDSAYLSAVESGDMETAQRMVDEAARAAGYDWEAFRGQPESWTEIPGSTEWGSLKRPVIFLTSNKRAAKPYNKNVKRFWVRRGDFEEVRAGGWNRAKSAFDVGTPINEALEAGKDGVLFREIRDLPDDIEARLGSDQRERFNGDLFAAFDKGSVKSADPVTYDESGAVIPISQRFNPARDDIRFADRKTKPNQQVFGQDVGREDEIQSKEEVQSAVKGGYFDGDSVVSYWSKEAAFATLGDIEAGRIDPTADTGLDGANQALVTELWKFANAMLREEGDASLLNRMRGRVNDYWNREATRAARALNARGWAQSPMEGTLGKVEEGKREAVEKIEPGTQAVEMVEQIQRDVDASQEKVEDFSQAEIASVAAEVKGKRQTTAPGAPVTAGELALNAGRKVGRRLRAVAAKLDALLSADNDVLFSDPRATPEGKRSLIEKLILNQASTGRRKRGAFIRVAVELGLTEEVAANRFDRIAEIRAEAKTAREADAKEAREGKAEPSAEDKFLAALDEEASRLDKLNDKAKKISDRLQSGPKKRKPVDPAKRQPLDRLVFTALETVATRESIIKDGIRLGLTQEAAARLADAIAVESQARAGRRKKGEKKSIDARASEIANRFENPQDRPVREKNELRAIINETLRRDSTVSEKAFLDRMKAMGASAKDSADLWAAVSNERARRQELRDLRRKAKEEEAKDEEAMNLIRKLAKSQSDTQDNRPGQTPEQSVVMELYRDAIGYGPLRSRVGFVRELEAEGVTQDVANRLFDLALRERQNRTVFGKDRDANRVFGRPNLPATDKSVPFIMREILSHPSIKLVGPEERLRMMSALFQERAGLSPIDARAAAAKFDAILVKKWEEAALRLAEETATKKNAPWFRRKEAIGSEDLITLLDESVKAGTATADIEAVRALYQSFEGSSFSREKMTADLVRAGVPANLAGRMADLAISSKRAKKTTFDRLREAIRAGAMDPRKRLLDEVAKSNGWMDLTDTELQRLAELDAALADPNVTPFEDIRYKREMSRIINSSALPAPLSRSIREYYLASIFSGVKTWVLQTSVVFNAMANLGVRDPLVALASAARGDRAPLAGFVAATGNLGRYVRNAITDGSLALLTGDIRGIQEAEILAAVSGLEQIHDRNMVILRDPRSTLAQKTAAATKVFFAANRLFFRILSGLDNTFQGFIRTYTAELEAFSKAADLGIPRGKMREMTAEVLALTEAFAEEAESKGFGNIKILGRETSIPSPDKQAFVNDRISMAIFAALEGQGVNLDGIRERSFREAAIETGVADFQTGTLPFGRLAKHLQKWSNEGGIISTLLVPVVRTPYQVLHRSAWWSPYGLARIINTGVKTGGFRDFSKSPYESALADPVQLLRRSAETALGTAAFIALGVLMARNEDEPEEEKDFRINLSGPTTANRTQYTAWRQSGRRPFTMQFKVGDRWITLGFRKGGMEFFNFAATILGAWDQRKYNADSNSGSDLMNYTSTLGKELTGEALFFLRGFSSRYALMSEETIANQIGFMLSGFVPAASLLKTPTRLRDMQERETGAMAAFLSQMPVVPMMSPDMPMLNSLGDPLGANEKERSYVQSQFGMPVGWVPFKKRASNSTEAQDEDLYMLLFDKDYFPDVKSRKDFGDDVTLDQYRKFVTMRGQAIKSYLRANYVEFSTMDPEKFKDFVSNKSTEITKRVQKTLRIQ